MQTWCSHVIICNHNTLWLILPFTFICIISSIIWRRYKISWGIVACCINLRGLSHRRCKTQDVCILKTRPFNETRGFTLNMQVCLVPWILDDAFFSWALLSVALQMSEAILGISISELHLFRSFACIVLIRNCGGLSLLIILCYVS